MRVYVLSVTMMCMNFMLVTILFDSTSTLSEQATQYCTCIIGNVFFLLNTLLAVATACLAYCFLAAEVVLMFIHP